MRGIAASITIVLIVVLTMFSYNVGFIEEDISGECVSSAIEYGFYENKEQIPDGNIVYYSISSDVRIDYAQNWFSIDLAASGKLNISFSSLSGMKLKADQEAPYQTNFILGSEDTFTGIRSFAILHYTDSSGDFQLTFQRCLNGVQHMFHVNSYVRSNLLLSVQENDATYQMQIDEVSLILDGILLQSDYHSQVTYTKAEINHSIPSPLLFSTCIGGTEYDYSIAIDRDSENNIYIAGNTQSTYLPIYGGITTSLTGESLIFIMKFNYQFSSLEYVTFIGGDNNDYPIDISVTSTGEVIVAGWTSSSDFPFSYRFDSSTDYIEGFLFKLNSNGDALLFSSSIGGTPNALEIDQDENSYLTGDSYPDLPVVNAFNDTSNGGGEVFFMKVNSTGDGLFFSSYFGGGYHDYGYDIAIDDSRNIYITGETQSVDLPLTDAIDETLNGTRDAFVAMFNSTGTGLEFCTYIGGMLHDYGDRIEVDAAGNIYLVGRSASVDFPILNAFQSDLNGDSDTIFLKINSTTHELLFSSFLGGSSWDYPYDIEIDCHGNIYLSGTTQSPDFPLEDAYRDYLWSGNDIYLTGVTSDGGSLLFSTYFGGDQNEQFSDIMLDDSGNITICGMTSSDNFPTVTDFDNPPNGYVEAFVARFHNLTDSDDDEVRDYYESILGTNPKNNDSDSDLLLDNEIFIYGTNPLSNDSDDDALNDFDEIFVHTTNPLSNDSDEDSLSDYAEIFEYDTNPILADSDFDWLTDAEELFSYFTDPLNEDSDFDNLTDGFEILVLSSNPLSNDTDRDSLLDGFEHGILNTSPISNDTDDDSLTDDFEYLIYGTDPTLDDTDSDLLNDGREYLLGTNPFSDDSDNDTLTDSEEVDIYGTNPLSNDTDGDTYDDAWEIANGYDPLDPNVHPLQYIAANPVVLYAPIGVALVVVIVDAIRRRRVSSWDKQWDSL